MRDSIFIFVNLHLFTAKRLLIKSEGTAMEFFGERLGMYELDKSFISNGKPTYKHNSKNIYLHWNHASHWTVNIINTPWFYPKTNNIFSYYFDLIDCILIFLSCLLKRILLNIGDSSTIQKAKMVLVHRILPKMDGWFIRPKTMDGLMIVPL